jgi:hypothetical protein
MKKGFNIESFVHLPDGMTLKVYFKDEIAWEPYDSTKEYTREHGYKWKLYSFYNHEIKYAVKAYDFTDEQIAEFAHLCPCYACTFFKSPKNCSVNWVFGFLKAVFICKCCIGCLNSDLPSSHNINIAYKKSL